MAFKRKDITLSEEDLNKIFEPEKHVRFINKYAEDRTSYQYHMTEYLRMNGLYWGLTTLDLLGKITELDSDEVMEFISKCANPNGGISPCIDHDPHLLYTLSAVQIACTLNRDDELDKDKIANYIKDLQQPHGGFYGDKWDELDTRFSFCAVACLSLINRLHVIDIPKAVEFVMRCLNFDGGFGSKPDSESHSGLIYCCLGFLSITKHLDLVDPEKLGFWLCERQLPSGGLNGRPEKLPDLCYSWWVLASLNMIGRQNWINEEALKKFILACQDSETGGFSDRPGDMPDPYHTVFGIGSLSLMKYPGIKTINPCYCMPQEVLDRLKITNQTLEFP